MDKMESKLLDAYEDIVGLLNERQTLQTQIEDMHEAFRMRVLDVCDSLPNAQPTPRLNREWVDATRERLMEWMHEKGEMECRVRMWDLSSFQRQLRKSALAGFARHDADAEANKKYVSQYVINLIGYAVRVGRFPEEIVRSMYEHERNEIEFNLKLADNFKNMEKERMDQECTMFTCAMAGQNISKWTEEHARRSEYWTFEREKMYYEIHHARKQVLRLREAAELELNALYGERAEFMDKQIKDLEEVALRAKRLRELCATLEISEELRFKIWTCFENSLVHRTDLMVDRHLDQLLMCAIYIMAKVGFDMFERSLSVYYDHVLSQSLPYRHRNSVTCLLYFCCFYG